MADPIVELQSWRRTIRGADEATLARRGWYACYTRARHEKRVARVFSERGFDRYLPVVAQDRQWHDRRRKVEFPLFPGYVFVKVAPVEIFEVTCVPSVVSVVMMDGRPALIGEGEIENVRRCAQALSLLGEPPDPHPMVEVGEKIVVRSGPFEGVEGVVTDVRGSSRLVVGVAALGQGFAVNFPASQVEKLTSSNGPAGDR